MHETVIARNIIAEAERHGTVKAIMLEIGELAAVPAHELIACLRRLKPEWKVHFSETKAIVQCLCGFKGNPTVLERGHDSFMIECPDCQSMPDIQSGTDIILKEVIIA